MQDELTTEYPSLPITLLSINMIGSSSGVASFSSDMDLPMVQDTDSDLIWDAWGGEWRDIRILDGENKTYATVNLTTYSLGNSGNYDSLKALLVGAAEGTLCADVVHTLDADGDGSPDTGICQ